MKSYQDTETGNIWAFEDDVDPHTLNNRHIPTTLTENIKPKLSDSHVWYQGDWVRKENIPLDYIQPVSSIPSYNPAWITYLLPYTAVLKNESSNLNITLEQVNENSYDGNKLSLVVTSLPLNFPSGIPALISYDGAIAIPRCADCPTNITGLEKLNEILCSLLIGGIHTEITHPKDLVCGSLENKSELFSYTTSIHTQLRSNDASITNRLAPLMYPRILTIKEIQEAYIQGQHVINSIYNFSPFFFLNGYTAFQYQNNSDALNNLWITVEQLTEFLWKEFFQKDFAKLPKQVKKIHDHLKRTNQLQNIVSMHKLLRLSKIISKKCQKTLSRSRVIRNRLAHSGTVPKLEDIKELWIVLPHMFEVASNIQSLGFRKLSWSGETILDTPGRTNFDEWTQLSQTLE